MSYIQLREQKIHHSRGRLESKQGKYGVRVDLSMDFRLEKQTTSERAAYGGFRRGKRVRAV